MNAQYDGEEVRFVYQMALEDIRFFKRQQWVVTNYTILVYGAIIGVAKYLGMANNECLAYIIWIMATISFLIVLQIQCSMQNVRKLKAETMEKIPIIDKFYNSGTKSFRKCLNDYSVFSLLEIVILGGGVLTICVLCKLCLLV